MGILLSTDESTDDHLLLPSFWCMSDFFHKEERALRGPVGYNTTRETYKRGEGIQGNNGGAEKEGDKSETVSVTR